MSNPQNNNGKRIVRTLSRTVDNAVLLTLLVCLVFSHLRFWDTHQMLAAADANNYQTYKPTSEETKSFDDFRAMNNDVIGWLTIYDSTIDYPLPIANPFPEEEEQQNLGGRLDIFSLIDRFQNFTIWQWILILIALILITYLLYKAERHRLLKKRERKQKAATENGESEA